MGFLWDLYVEWTGSGLCKMAGLTLEVSELSAYAVTALVAPFSSCNHTFTTCAVNITMRQVWTLVHTHWAAACVTAAQQCSILLTLPSASGCRYATILAAPPPPLPQIAGVACIPQGILFHNFVSTAEINAKSVFKSGRECSAFDVIFLNSHRVTGNNSYRLICERHTFKILYIHIVTGNNSYRLICERHTFKILVPITIVNNNNNNNSSNT
jgi:hypothetical protein